MQSREVRLRRRPTGVPQPDDFELATVEVPEPDEDEVTVRNLFMSVDPYMRGRMRDRSSYVDPFEVGEVLSGGSVGVVTESRHPELEPGDAVLGDFGWREAFTARGGKLRRLGPLEDLPAPVQAYLGVLGMPGMTAYFGLLEVAGLQDGDTVFVSGAAGAVGSVVGQIARIHGCRVLGSAGSQEKVEWLTRELGFDYAFDYHGGRLRDHLREGAPEGLDVYYDNVGGAHLEAAIGHMRRFGRIALCGAISQYNAEEPPPGPRNLFRAIGMGLTLRGFLVSQFSERADEFRAAMTGWMEEGSVRHRETIRQGIESAPGAFIGLFEGENIGKMLVRLGEPD